jgi:alkylation response protein AidB-like acyl-CoA dehydrogenase
MPDGNPTVSTAAGSLDATRRIVSEKLHPLTVRIDQEGLYPKDVLRDLGSAGAFSQHLSARGDPGDMASAIDVMAAVSEECLSTSFMMWCQNACAWYLEQTENDSLRAHLQDDVASARQLGGTALSNPMKHFAGIEPLRLFGRRVSDGYVLDGQLPWVSNLGPDHVFGAIFGVKEGDHERRVMALIDCAEPGVSLRQDAHFTALEGTGTFSVRFADAFVADASVLADPAEAMVGRIRAGFVLLQTGMGIGLVHACLDIMRRSDRSLEHVNRFLDDRPDDLSVELDTLAKTVRDLAATPTEQSPDYMRLVLQARADISTLSLRSATSALLHTGARGYLSHSPAQRRLREAHFVAIVTPALKHLRKELAQMSKQ